MSRILLFGGSFDPIHHGHLIVGRAAAERIGAARVVLIPSALPPHKLDRQLAPGPDRLEMCRLATRGDALFEVSDIEQRGGGGPNYSLLTVQAFRATAPAATELCWLIGMDSLAELDTWHRVGDLANACTLVTAARGGYAAPDLSRLERLIGGERVHRIRAHIVATPQIEISATDIRARVQAGRSIRYLTPEAVCESIAARGLYR